MLKFIWQNKEWNTGTVPSDTDETRSKVVTSSLSEPMSGFGSACEVLRVSELQVEVEQQVQRLDPAAVHGDVQQGAHEVHILHQAAVEAGGRQLQTPQQLLQLAWPLLHQAVDIGHRAAVVDARRWFGAVQRTDAIHPAVHRPRNRLRTRHARHLLQLRMDRQDEDRQDKDRWDRCMSVCEWTMCVHMFVYIDVCITTYRRIYLCGSVLFGFLRQPQRQNRGVRLLHTGLVQSQQTQSVCDPVRPRHLDASQVTMRSEVTEGGLMWGLQSQRSGVYYQTVFGVFLLSQ